MRAPYHAGAADVGADAGADFGADVGADFGAGVGADVVGDDVGADVDADGADVFFVAPPVICADPRLSPSIPRFCFRSSLFSLFCFFVNAYS